MDFFKKFFEKKDRENFPEKFSRNFLDRIDIFRIFAASKQKEENNMTDKEMVEAIRKALREKGSLDSMEQCLQTMKKIVDIVFPVSETKQE